MIAWADLESGQVTKLFDAHPGFSGRELAPMETVRFKSRDGLVVEGYLTRAVGLEGAGPIIVMPHDGPEERDIWGFDPIVQYFAARGFGVFQPNYRGSKGYGRLFEQSGHGEWGEAVLFDVIDGARALVKAGIADPKRLGIFGRGFGGYLALQALVVEPELFAAGASFGAVTDLARMLADDRRFIGQSAIDELIVIPRPGGEAALPDFSPANRVSRIRVPVLIGHGSENPRFPEKHADVMVAALRRAGKPVESLRYEGDTQVFLDDRHRIDFYLRLGDFFERALSKRETADLEAASSEHDDWRQP